MLTEATVSVKAGSRWQRFTLRDLAPQHRRRLEREADLGVIEADLAGDHTGVAQRPGDIYWDRVRFAGAGPLRLVRRPERARIEPIPDCPRIDISGVWVGPDGTELHLSQRGRTPRGFVRRGPLSEFPNPVDGVFDGRTFSGALAHRAGRSLSPGTFSLTFTEDRRLQGEWTLSEGAGQRRRGTWNLTRVGPGPPAPRRR